MSDLSYMQKLLHGEEVEWMSLADVVEFKRGEQLKPTNIIAGPYPVVTASKTETGSHSRWNFGPASVTITSHGAYAGHVNYWPTPIWLGNNVFLLLPGSKLISKFLFYYLKSIELRIQGLAKGGGVPYFNTRDIAPFLVPIPPLHVQKEIVRILDTFTELTTALTTELTNRQKQYNHYRDQLLSYEEAEVEWRTLGEISKVLRGKRLTKSLLSASEKYAVFHGGLEPLGYYQDFNRPANSVMVINVGASAGTVGYSSVDFWSSDGCFCIEHSERVESRYLYYYLIGVQHLLRSKVRVAGIPTLDAVILEKLRIPIPPLAEQAHIVAILDKFATITQSISDGLPREIELRQKQYAHYRDLLLNFPKPKIVA